MPGATPKFAWLRLAHSPRRIAGCVPVPRFLNVSCFRDSVRQSDATIGQAPERRVAEYGLLAKLADRRLRGRSNDAILADRPVHLTPTRDGELPADCVTS